MRLLYNCSLEAPNYPLKVPLNRVCHANSDLTLDRLFAATMVMAILVVTFHHHNTTTMIINIKNNNNKLLFVIIIITIIIYNI